ncbi:MAG: hypothetical protein R2688_07965 [Fimbriimonadaceae bacterium]
MDQLVNLLKEKTGLDDAMAEKVVGFIKEHMHEIPKMLGGDLGDKAKGLLGGAGGGLMDQAKGLLGGGDD